MAERGDINTFYIILNASSFSYHQENASICIEFFINFCIEIFVDNQQKCALYRPYCRQPDSTYLMFWIFMIKRFFVIVMFGNVSLFLDYHFFYLPCKNDWISYVGINMRNGRMFSPKQEICLNELGQSANKRGRKFVMGVGNISI